MNKHPRLEEVFLQLWMWVWRGVVGTLVTAQFGDSQWDSSSPRKKRTWEKKREKNAAEFVKPWVGGLVCIFFLPSRILKMPGISGLPEIAAEQWGRKEEAGLLQFLGFFVARGRHFCDALFPLKSYRSFFLILLFFLCPIAFQVRERGKGGKLTALASASAAEASEGNKTSASPPPLLPHFRRWEGKFQEASR